MLFNPVAMPKKYTTPNTRVAADFKNHPDALKRLLQRALADNRSAGKQLLTEHLASEFTNRVPAKTPTRRAAKP